MLRVVWMKEDAEKRIQLMRSYGREGTHSEQTPLLDSRETARGSSRTSNSACCPAAAIANQYEAFSLAKVLLTDIASSKKLACVLASFLSLSTFSSV